MTIESWKAEFYPIEAIDTRRDEAIQHTLRKWTGARPENLAKYELIKDRGSIICDNYANVFSFGGGSCALCVHYYCDECPLAEHTGKTCMNGNSEYQKWIRDNDPEPMIKALEEILAKEQS